MIRAVFDTVIFVRALINQRGRWGRLVFERSDDYILVLSADIVREVLGVVSRPALRRRLPSVAHQPTIDALLAILRKAEVVEPEEVVAVCRDRNDDKFFACAVAGGAQYIVSEDQDILAIGEYERVRTVTAAEFLDLID